MKIKHDVFFGFAVLLIAAMFTLSGCGPKATPAEDFEFEDGSIMGYNGNSKDVVIPAKINGKQVTTIYGLHWKELTSVIIPNGVVTIGEQAFFNNSLTRVTIPKSVTSIRNDAFRGNKLTSVTIPNAACEVSTYAFDSETTVIQGK